MLYMVCIGENYKQKNEVSGYETLWEITWDIDISIFIQKTQLVVQRLLSCLQFL